MNFNEAKAFFGKQELEEVLDELRKIGKPCFFRAGERGAYSCRAAKRHFLPAVGWKKAWTPQAAKLFHRHSTDWLCRRGWARGRQCHGKCLGGGSMRASMARGPLPRRRPPAGEQQKGAFCAMLRQL